MRALSEIAEALPRAIADDVLGYARSVQASLPDIFGDAKISEDAELGERVVFLAGIKKLESAISTQFWTLDNSLHLMEEASVGAVRIGSAEISRGSDYHRRLQAVVRELEHILAREGLSELLEIRSYTEILRQLRRGR